MDAAAVGAPRAQPPRQAQSATATAAAATAATAGADATLARERAKRRTLTLSSSDHEGRPQQIVVLEASVSSDATANSSDRSSDSSDDECDDEDDALADAYGAHSLLLDEVADEPPRSAPGAADGAADGLLVKPMTKRLPVCPVDDLAVEEEKRLRRSRQQQQQGKAGAATAKKRSCGDTDSLPTPPGEFGRLENHPRSNSASDISTAAVATPAAAAAASTALGPLPASKPGPFLRRNSSPGESLSSRSPGAISLSSPRVATGAPNGGTLPTVTPLLRKDSMAIRRQYWSQLGFSLSRSDLEKSTGRTRVRREGMRVRLNDAKSDRDDVSGFFQFIRSWYRSGDDKDHANTDRRGAADGSSSSSGPRSALHRPSSTRSRSSSVKRGVHFHEEAELFYIPLHRDYSKRQRECMWPTRAEFISMVERNLDEVYEEMEREYEEQLAAEERETNAMMAEERRQRAIEKAQAEEAARQQKREAEAAKQAAKQAAQVAAQAAAVAIASPPTSSSSGSNRSPPGSSSGSPPLALTQTEVKVVPRARSSHEIRFKYLRHLGINS